MINRVRRMREALGLSQGDLATQLQVSRQTINSIEVERYTPSLPLAMSLAKFFAVTVEQLFGPEEGPVA